MEKLTVIFSDVVAALADHDVAVFERSSSGTIEEWSHSAERKYGYTADEMRGRRPAMIVPPEFEALEQRWTDCVLADACAIRVETERIAKDSSRRTVSLNLIPLRDDLGIVVRVAHIERELSRKQAPVADHPSTNSERRVNALAPFRAQYRTPSGRGETILVVDDDLTIREMLCRALRERGYSVVAASTGAEALRLVETAVSPIDLVLSDVVMPEVDGRALYAHIRTLYPNVRFIFMTGTESDSGMFDVFGGAPASCLNKPFEMTSLLLEVRHALDDA